jgi:hypothetical protein
MLRRGQRSFQGNVRGVFKFLFGKSPGGTEEVHEMSVVGYPPRSEPNTPGVWRSGNHSTTPFGTLAVIRTLEYLLDSLPLLKLHWNYCVLNGGFRGVKTCWVLSCRVTTQFKIGPGWKWAVCVLLHSCRLRITKRLVHKANWVCMSVTLGTIHINLWSILRTNTRDLQNCLRGV